MAYITEILRPSSDIWNITVFRFPMGGTYYSKINEVVPDEDTTYLRSSFSVGEGMYGYSSTVTTLSRILKVTYTVRARLTGASATPYFEYDFRVGTNFFVLGKVFPTTSYTDYTYELPLSPVTNSAWTLAEVNTITSGFSFLGTGSVDVRITQLYLTIYSDITDSLVGTLTPSKYLAGTITPADNLTTTLSPSKYLTGSITLSGG